ncbi:hypothetical protein E4T56_gene5897 [Termitomyces sp. T112]|nr:hypothetical protein E4T56_gene5897 [Termitomyces sp. T112]
MMISDIDSDDEEDDEDSSHSEVEHALLSAMSPPPFLSKTHAAWNTFYVNYPEQQFQLWGTVAQLAPSCPKAGHMICECKVGVSTLAECACVEKHLRHHVGYFNAAGKPPPARARLARLCSAGRPGPSNQARGSMRQCDHHARDRSEKEKFPRCDGFGRRSRPSLTKRVVARVGVRIGVNSSSRLLMQCVVHRMGSVRSGKYRPRLLV